jgi:hypothetical protein
MNLSSLAKTFFTYKVGKMGLKWLAVVGIGQWLYKKWQSQHSGTTLQKKAA